MLKFDKKTKNNVEKKKILIKQIQRCYSNEDEC